MTKAKQIFDHRVIFVTGPSGAGRSTAINALEDMGYEVIDNIPLSLVPRLIEGDNLGRPIALGLDARNRDFNAAALIALIDGLTVNPHIALNVIYLDCAEDELIRRFSQTRRRHPLAPDGTPLLGIAREVDLLAPVKVRADHLIEPTGMSPHDLRAEIAQCFGTAQDNGLAVSLHSFSYKRGVPRGVDMVFDCRFLRNPHWDAALRDMDGRDTAVVDYIAEDPRFAEFLAKVTDLILFLLPAQMDEGKTHLAIAFGCTGGQHRSVAVTELIARSLAEAGWPVAQRHREMERKAAVLSANGTG
jgi:UPF0042 nucleotide-binding protein